MTQTFCAHRGLSALMPENTLPAFGAALAFGCDEIEFDVRLTKDARLIVSHDGTLERISDGKGELSNFTLAELQELNIGVKHGWQVSFCTAEDVFAHFAGQMIFNIHLKEHGEDGYLVTELRKLVDKYQAKASVYFAASPAELYWMEKKAPDIARCAIQLPGDNIPIYDMAKTYGCKRVQFWLGMFDKELIDKLHNDNILCNLFYADDFENYDKYFAMGIDNLLTNRMDLAAAWKKRH